MNDSFRPKKLPRGFVSLEAAAEILWQDDLDRDALWGIAFLQLAANSQGFTATGNNADIRLRWWQANGSGPIFVRADDVPVLRPAFRKWCGVPAPSDYPTSALKRRGRPKGSTIAGDDTLVKRALDLWHTGNAKSPTDAARIVSKHAQGASPEANYDRLRKKVVEATKVQCRKRNH